MADKVEYERTTLAPTDPKNWPRVLRIKARLEIAAIFVAAIWASWNFWEYTRPGGAKLVEFGSTLEWNNRTSTGCEAEYSLNFHNLSKRRITVSKIRVRAWYMDDVVKPTDATPITYLEPTMYDRRPIFDSDRDVHPPLERLVSDFGPTEQDTEGLTFFVKQAPGKRMIFWTELWSDDGIDVKDYLAHPTWTDNRHDWVCGAAPVGAAN